MVPRVVTFGEIMLRLSPPGNLRLSQARSFDATYGGGEANVAASLANFGVQADFVTRLPANDLGQACLQFLQQYGVGTRHILSGGDRLGIYFLENGAAQRSSKVTYDRSGSAFATIQPGMLDWKKVFEGATWFHWTGITPAISEGAAAVCLQAVKAARALGLTISTVARTQLLANQMAMVIGFLPTFLLSGFTFSIANMPTWLQIITYGIAPRYYVTILKEIFLKGVGFSFLWRETLVLMGMAMAGLWVATRSFKKELR